MAAQTFTVELDEDQARIVAETAAAYDLKPEAVLIDAIGHGLAMIVAGVDDSDLSSHGTGPERSTASRSKPPGRDGSGSVPRPLKMATILPTTCHFDPGTSMRLKRNSVK